MKITFTKRNIFVLITSLALVALFALVWIANQNTPSLSQNKEIPAPYNQFNYAYIVLHSLPSSATDISYLSYINRTLIQSTSTHSAVFSDGKGFYQYQPQAKQSIMCGGQPLNAGSNLDFVHQICISVRGKNYVVTDTYYVDGNYVVYEQCRKIIFYPSYNANDCSEYALKVNDTVIDTSSEGYDYIDNIPFSAPRFGNVKVDGNVVTYVKSYQSPDSLGRDEFISYNFLSNTKKILYSSPDNSSIANAQLIDGKPAILLRNYSGVDLAALNGMTSDDRANYLGNILENTHSSLLFPDGKKIDNVNAFASNNGHLYFLQQRTIAVFNTPTSTLLFKDNLGALEFTPITPSPQALSIGIYPGCDSNSSVCLYNNGDYLAKAELTASAAQNVSSAYTAGGIVASGPDDRVLASQITNPTIYYPNGIKMEYAFEDWSIDLPFVFSSNGDTYLVYFDRNNIYGQDVSRGDQPIKLFQVDPPTGSTIESLHELRVFPK